MLAEGPLETTVEVRAEFRVRRGRGGGESADDHLAAGWERGEVLADEVTQASLDTMAEDGVAHGSADHEPDLRLTVRA